MKNTLVLLAALLTAGSALAQRPRCPRPDRPCYFATFENPDESAQWKGTGGATGGVETSYVPDVWHRYEAIQFFVYAGQPGALKVELGARAASVSHAVILKKGSNLVQFRLKDFTGVDLGKVDRFQLTFAGGGIYLDRFRLGEFNEVLAKFGRIDAPYDMTIETPHVKWARPFAKGPLKVLIVPDVAHGRATIDLAQRLDCTLFPVSLAASSGTNRWGFGDFYGERGDSYGAARRAARS